MGWIFASSSLSTKPSGSSPPHVIKLSATSFPLCAASCKHAQADTFVHCPRPDARPACALSGIHESGEVQHRWTKRSSRNDCTRDARASHHLPPMTPTTPREIAQAYVALVPSVRRDISTEDADTQLQARSSPTSSASSAATSSRSALAAADWRHSQAYLLLEAFLKPAPSPAAASTSSAQQAGAAALDQALRQQFSRAVTEDLQATRHGALASQPSDQTAKAQAWPPERESAASRPLEDDSVVPR